MSQDSIHDDRRLLGREDVVRSLQDLAWHGQAMLIYGPLGIGKTAVLVEVSRRTRQAGRPCALCARTERLSDVTAALASCYPAAATACTERQRRNRLRLAAADNPGVLFLDHLSDVGTALKGYLRSLRGTGLGVIIAADVENPRDFARVRAHRLAYHELALGPLSGSTLRRLLERQIAEQSSPFSLSDPDREAIIRIAQGRPGWVVRLVAASSQPRYWSERRLRADLLAADCLLAVTKHYGERLRRIWSQRR